MSDDLRLPFDVLPEPIRPRKGENDRAYAGLLLYCMQAPAERSMRCIGKSMGVAASTVNYWRKKHRWDARMIVVSGVEWVALRAYRILMDTQDGAGQQAALHVAMDVVLDQSGLSEIRHAVAMQRQGKEVGPPEHAVDPTKKPAKKRATKKKASKPAPARVPPPKDEEGARVGPIKAQHFPTKAFTTPMSDLELELFTPGTHLRKLRAHALDKHLQPADLDRQVGLIDGILELIMDRVKDGTLKVTVADVPRLLKARALLTGLPTEQVAVAVQHKHKHEHDHSLVVESARMREARKEGGHSFIAAMQDELDDINVVMGAIPTNIIEIQGEEIL